MKKFIIIDGNALVHRAFHALPPTLSTKDGTIVNAVYGFTVILLKALKEIKPEYMALTFDVAEKNFRDEMYKEYKATRVKAPDELYRQIPIVKKIAEVFRIPIYEKAGFEADDVIGTLCKHPEVDRKDLETVIVTGDMDTFQLVDQNTKVLTLKKGITETMLYDPEAVKERFGFSPAQIIDYKALCGDASDNIPGVKGIGAKTAKNLIAAFATLENIYEAVESGNAQGKIPDRVMALLKAHKDEALLSKRLATIVTSVPITFHLEDCIVQPLRRDEVVKLFTDLQFRSLIHRIPEDVSSEQGTLFQLENLKKNFRYKLINTPAAFDVFFKKLQKQKAFTFDTETTGLDTISAELLGIAFSWKEGEAYFVSVASLSEALDALRPIFENPRVKKYAHNLKYDYEILYQHGVKMQGVAFDSMIASYLLAPGTRSHSLDHLAFVECSHEMVKLLDIAPKIRGGGLDMKAIPVETLSLYSCEDADFTQRLVARYEPKLKTEGLWRVFSEIEMPLIPVLASMELYGVKIDVPFLNKLSQKIRRELGTIDRKIFQLAGRTFNIDSPQQMQVILFDELKLPTQGLRKSQTGISTDASELEKIKDVHPVILLILRHRELSKLKSTYTDALQKLVHPKTGRVHTSFHQTIAATGRLSSANPNLQNIPVRTELGNQVRKAFIAEPGCSIVSCDYSQIELRLVAHIASDKNLTAIFRRDEDVHTATAARLYGIPLNQVTKTMRSAAKTVNFGVLYGQGPRALALQTGMSFEEAKAFIERYFELFSSVKEYIEQTKALAHSMGYVETLLGRRRYLPDIYSGVAMLRAAAERMAVNTPIQGTSADLIKIAMVQIHQNLQQIKGARMILQVHDELLFEVEDALVEQIAAIAKQEMEGALKLRVPLKVDVSVGKRWGELKRV